MSYVDWVEHSKARSRSNAIADVRKRFKGSNLRILEVKSARKIPDKRWFRRKGWLAYQSPYSWKTYDEDHAGQYKVILKVYKIKKKRKRGT